MVIFKKEVAICDFSLQAVKSRAAVVGDKLVTRDFGTGTRGFASADDLDCAVCVLPGTEIAFDQNVELLSGFYLSGAKEDTGHKVARFRQIRKDQPHTHHDVVELPNGDQHLLTMLATGQTAVILQLPATPKTPEEVQEQERAVYAG